MKSILLPALLLVSHLGLSQNDFGSVYAKAKESYKSKDPVQFYKLILDAVNLNPNHQGALYYAGVAAALNSKPEESISFLKRSTVIDSRYDIQKNEDLASLRERNDFKEVMRLQEEMNKPQINSDTTFTIKERQLHVEGIAYDPKSKVFYLGAIHQRKIVKVDAAGYVSDFSQKAANEMASVFGLKLDLKRKLLWACSSPIPETDNYDPATPSKIFKFNISNGALLDSYVASPEMKAPIFGDLVLNNKGEVFVSDGKNNIIFKVNETTKKLEKVYESQEFINLQGITFSDDNSILFIADYVKGLYKLEMKTKALSKISCNLNASVKGIDGLIFYKGSLIAIQNGVVPLRSVRYILSADNAAIIDFKTIDRNHPAFNEPTLGTIDKDTLYYIANSQWSGYTDDHKIKPYEQLQDIVILKTSLKN